MPPLKLLLIETSGPIGRVGVAMGPTLLAERVLDRTRRHARDLAPAVQELLRGQGWNPNELSGVIVSLGPGSYTGLRVGVMAAKALAYTVGCPLAAVPTFAVIALQAARHLGDAARQVEVIGDAQQDRVYVERFAIHGSRLSGSAVPLAVIDGQVWRSALPPDLPVTGPGLAVHESKLPPSQPLLPADTRAPQLAGLLELGLAHLDRGDYAPILTLEPLYLRPSSAEEKWTALGR